MSLLNQIQKFNKSKLKKTETEVTREDGRHLIETRDEEGNIKVKAKEGYSLGFVGDYKPDLQVGEVLPGMIMGSQDLAADFDLLSKHKVTHILNVASMVENCFPQNFQYHRVAILDLPSTDIRQYFPECFDFIQSGIKSGCVLVHCNAGRSRSASIVIGYLMKYLKMSFEEAFDHLKSKRPSAEPNIGFLLQLKQYEP